MAATAMDPVDIANILAQELLYQQVFISRAQSISEYFHKVEHYCNLYKCLKDKQINVFSEQIY